MFGSKKGEVIRILDDAIRHIVTAKNYVFVEATKLRKEEKEEEAREGEKILQEMGVTIKELSKIKQILRNFDGWIEKEFR